MKRLLAAGLALLAAPLALSACATVQSQRDPDYQAHDEARGLTYFLPMRMLRFTATRTPLRIGDLNRTKSQKEAELTRLRGELDTAKGTRERLERRLARLPATATATTRAAVQAELDAATADEASLKARVETAEADLAAINTTISAVQVGGAACSYTAKLEYLPAQADPDLRFVMRPAHNILRDDTVRLNVSQAGLLNSANVIAADRTGDIIVEIAGAVGGARAGVRGSAQERSTEPPCATLPAQFVHVFDPLRDWVHAPATPVAQTTLPAIAQLNTALTNAFFPFQIQVDASALVVRAAPPQEGQPAGSARRFSATPDFDAPGGAIYYRSPVPITFTVQQRLPRRSGDQPTDPDRWQSVDAAVVMLPQAGPITYIPMNSAAFVRTVNDVQFTDGSISAWNTERPSEAYEVVRLPVRALTAFASVPAQLLSVQVDIDTRERNLIELQRQQIEQQERLRLLRECIALADSEETSASACLE